MIWRVYQIVFGLVATVAILLAAYAFNDASNTTTEIVESAQTSCEEVGEPLRSAVIGILRDEINAARTTDFESLFPDIPPAELERLLEADIKALQGRIDALRAVPTCAERFSSSRTAMAEV